MVYEINLRGRFIGFQLGTLASQLGREAKANGGWNNDEIVRCRYCGSAILGSIRGTRGPRPNLMRTRYQSVDR